MLEQYHLTGKRHSGRAVRVRGLDDISVADNLAAAARMCSSEASYVEVKKKEWALGLKQFVVEVSEPCEDEFDPSLKWKKVNPQSFDEGLATFFTAKDVQVLEAIYREYHEVTKDELDKITGKAKAVSEG